MKFLKKNLLNAALVLLLLVVIFVPDAKAFLIKGLMEIGFYKPEIETPIAPDMSLSGIRFKDAKGNLVDLGDLKGKVIFLNFWATWCPPCRAEMPSVNKLYKQFKDDKNVVFIFADADGDLGKSTRFMADRKYEMPVYKVESNVPEEIFSGVLPTTIIFDKQGRLSLRHEGAADYADKKIVDFLNKLSRSN
ncbi:TlpA family protein disulfide reductase [Pedobacter sp. HDW13]|uniref:TlpA family protein disulfide reductase n=1 Tax=Pedobacter sp. HDW13 TaxID=2714940 RepID=UPI000F5ACE01|nr:TlpA disulfide reductase family protein [Pedobacter sp. HDW13]QIL39679.1 TlpA family protein disulfide reductase [Pedobacter sp. HDW13]RQO79893.1 TlpA family protein disulfide reductase [Pedobacter sp. KBW01]